jgi:Tol biopolymer transport system component
MPMRHLTASLLATTALLLAAPALAGGDGTQRLSVGTAAQQGDGSSIRGGLSADARHVAFTSAATNLVPGSDANGALRDILLLDRLDGTIDRVSVSSSEVQANGASDDSFISRNGRYVAFASDATNLVPGDTNGLLHIFLRDVQAGTTSRVSVGPGGQQVERIPDRPAPVTFAGGLSGNGRFAVFSSSAESLVAGDTNTASDVFVHDRVLQETARASVGKDGTQANGRSFTAFVTAGTGTANRSSFLPGVISNDGRFVAFHSAATNLVPGDANGVFDAFIRDREEGTTSLVSIAEDGKRGNGSSTGPFVSDDGRIVAFTSNATNLVPGDTNGALDVFVRDRQEGTTTRVSRAADGGQTNGFSIVVTMSPNGRYVVYWSAATNVAPEDTNGFTDVFVHDRETGETQRLEGAGGEQPNRASNFPATPGGSLILFSSDASNLVPGDTNGATDVFLTDQHHNRTAATAGRLRAAAPEPAPRAAPAIEEPVEVEGQ